MGTPVLSDFEVTFPVDGGAAAEVDDERIQKLVNHDVMRFEVSVKDTFGAEEAQSFSNFV